MKFTDFYMLEVIGLASLGLFIISALFFIIAVVSEKNNKLYSFIGGGSSVACAVLFVYSIFVGMG